MNIIPMILLLLGFLMMVAPLFDRAIPAVESLIGISRALRRTYHSAPLEVPPVELSELAKRATERVWEDDQRKANLKVVRS